MWLWTRVVISVLERTEGKERKTGSEGKTHAHLFYLLQLVDGKGWKSEDLYIVNRFNTRFVLVSLKFLLGLLFIYTLVKSTYCYPTFTNKYQELYKEI